MVRYIAIRVLLFIVTLFLIMTLTYFALHIVIARRFVTDTPFLTDLARIWERYRDYLQGIFTEFDWGTDRYRRDVWDLLSRRMWRTLRLNIVAFFYYTVFGLLLGTIAAVWAKRWPDKVISVFVLILSSLPAYLLMMILVVVIGYRLDILPPQMPYPTRPLSIRLQGFILPVFVMGGLPLANITRLIRGEIRDLFHSNYLLLLRAKGLNRRQTVTRHMLKDAIVSMMPELPSAMIYALVSGFIVEIIYNVQGTSSWLFNSMFQPFLDAYYVNIDIEPTMLIVIFYAALALGVGFLIDIVYRFLDPRMTLTSENNTIS